MKTKSRIAFFGFSYITPNWADKRFNWWRPSWVWKGGGADRKCEKREGGVGELGLRNCCEKATEKPSLHDHIQISWAQCLSENFHTLLIVCQSVCEWLPTNTVLFKSVWKACSAFPKRKPCFPCVTAWIIPPLRMHSHCPDSRSLTLWLQYDWNAGQRETLWLLCYKSVFGSALLDVSENTKDEIMRYYVWRPCRREWPAPRPLFPLRLRLGVYPVDFLCVCVESRESGHRMCFLFLGDKAIRP